MDQINLFNILFPTLIAIAVASRGFAVDEGYVARWARWFNLTLTAENAPAVRRYLAWTRRSRTAGGLAGFLAPTFYYAIFSPGPQPDNAGAVAVTFMLVGYLLGAVIAEAVIDPPTRRSESDNWPVRLGNHLPTYALVLQRGLGIASVLLVAVYALVEPNARVSGLPGMVQVGAMGIAAACGAVVVEVFQRRILARPRQAQMAVDHAMRASSVHVLAGGAIAVLAHVAGALALLAGVAVTAEPSAVHIPLFVAFGLVFFSSIYFWLYFGKPNGFGVRRGVGREATT
jgi:hypothetical protein